MPSTSSSSADGGTLYLLPVPIAAVAQEEVLPPYNLEVMSRLRHFIVEDERAARRFLHGVLPALPLGELRYYPIGKHAPRALYSSYLEPLLGGVDMGLLSEAGCPAVADPGAVIVALAQERGLRVVPLVGPSSLLLALMASGSNGQEFSFRGYLPREPQPLRRRILELERLARSERATQLFIETPFRAQSLFSVLLATLHPETLLCVAALLTSPQGYVRTRSVLQWRRLEPPRLLKTPAVFLICSPAPT